MTGRPPTPPEVRFWKYVDKDGPYCEALSSRCWLWTGATNKYPHGEYGRFRDGNSRMVQSHRFSWELANGPTDAEAVDHLCNTPQCVNPGHLKPGTQSENVLRGSSPHAVNARKTTCPQGHTYDRTWKGRRMCSTCRRESYQRWENKQRGIRKPDPGTSVP